MEIDDAMSSLLRKLFRDDLDNPGVRYMMHAMRERLNQRESLFSDLTREYLNGLHPGGFDAIAFDSSQSFPVHAFKDWEIVQVFEELMDGIPAQDD